MAHRNIHYEAAFENYLRAKGWPYVAVDEAKKAIFDGVPVKSFDFLVYSASGPNLLVDVKGRKFPDGVRGRRRGGDKAYENWITQQDADDLREWEKVFGRDFMALLVFAYWLQGPPQRSPFEDVHLFRENHYAFVAIPLSGYLSAAKPRSAKWQTLGMPSAELAEQAGDIARFL
jgi:hypothetical protein